MALAKPGEIKNFCLPNCLLTFKEYVLDYGEMRMKQQAEDTIAKELANIDNNSVKKITKRKLEQLEHGARDLYF
jgi:2-iminoacetate synthase